MLVLQADRCVVLSVVSLSRLHPFISIERYLSNAPEASVPLLCFLTISWFLVYGLGH